MLLPPPLKVNDRLMAIAPCGTLRKREKEKFLAGLKIWEDRGYHIDLEDNYQAQDGYLAGSDEIRRQALYKAWTNPEYKAIICVRGGYGGARLLENWQWMPIDTPKWLIGFSDVTTLLWSLYQENITALHGPVITTISQESPSSLKRLFDYLEGKKIAPLKGNGWGGGKQKGKLLVGNLTVATNILGTSLCPDFDGVILALEDVGEAPYRLDRMLTQWRLMGVLEKVKGIALGRFSGCDVSDNIPSWTAPEVLKERLGGLNIPIVSDLPFGHDGDNACLPLGQIAHIDGDEGILAVGDDE
ncbi:S66 peptidase family protein [Cyanobacterium sp. IPPAS B-1200]|uniref:S66 peptidase family protein n=1 Tax=Cyanobacterium sp. IPPAS B-1200 TaxID=1562720 RepID=UPI000852720B|nr:LD-carboxypeptidase [Cyanobacterium sp. IPPAS B-1200]